MAFGVTDLGVVLLPYPPNSEESRFFPNLKGTAFTLAGLCLRVPLKGKALALKLRVPPIYSFIVLAGTPLLVLLAIKTQKPHVPLSTQGSKSSFCIERNKRECC